MVEVVKESSKAGQHIVLCYLSTSRVITSTPRSKYSCHGPSQFQSSGNDANVMNTPENACEMRPGCRADIRAVITVLRQLPLAYNRKF